MFKILLAIWWLHFFIHPRLLLPYCDYRPLLHAIAAASSNHDQLDEDLKPWVILNSREQVGACTIGSQGDRRGEEKSQ